MQKAHSARSHYAVVGRLFYRNVFKFLFMVIKWIFNNVYVFIPTYILPLTATRLQAFGWIEMKRRSDWISHKTVDPPYLRCK